MSHTFSKTWTSSHNFTNGASHTITALRRWSCDDKQLPSVEQVKTIHIYDFDNTLFSSPLPNKQIWNGPTIGFLQNQDAFLNGGWWHDNKLLAATGEGIEKEEPKAWKGWWNEEIVELVELTLAQNDALCVLLTGRGESNFADIIKRMVKSKNLEFHMTCLKPAVGPNNQKFGSTMKFKQELLSDLVYTYKNADELRIYEDRPRHVKEFREYFHTFNQTLQLPDTPIPRKPITTEVIQVPEGTTSLDPVTEIAEVQRMINSHNTAIHDGTAPPSLNPLQLTRHALYTGYIISPSDTEKLISLAQTHHVPSNQILHLANNVLICPRPAPPHLLDRVGGIGATVRFRVTGLASLENKLWAARVTPVPENTKIFTENATPMVVLAVRRGAVPREASRIQNWVAVSSERRMEFEATVGEKVLLKVERESSMAEEGEEEQARGRWERGGERERERERDRERDRDNRDRERDKENGGFARRENPRKHPRDEDFPPLGAPSAPATRHQRDQPVPAFRGGEDNRKPSGGNAPRGGGNARGGRGGHGGSGQRGGGNQGRSGRDQRRGGGGGQGAGNRGRGRGGHPQYRSLDDVGDRGSGGYRQNGYADFDGANDRGDGGLYNAY
ncbi:MAG: hypothetical protein Q9165_002392 [Trypethelium subeluteriae]